MQNILIVKTLVYTGARVSEFIKIKIADVDFEACQIPISQGKKDRIVPFPSGFKEILALHANAMTKERAVYLFESSHKKLYTDRVPNQVESDELNF